MPLVPAARATIIVSPMARETARIIAATMPEMAAGTTTRRLVCHRLAPSPYDASRIAVGTARIASSDTDATSGTIRTPTAIPAARKLLCDASAKIRFTTLGVMNVRAKKPSTTLGMPARTSREGFRILRTFGRAYSER